MALQPKPADPSPSFGPSPNQSASQRPDEKSTEIDSDASDPLQQPPCDSDSRPARVEPKLAVAAPPRTGSPDRCAQATASLKKKPALRQSGCGTPASKAEADQQLASEIDHKSLYESFSLMYRTIFSPTKPASPGSRRPNKPLARRRPAEGPETLSDVARSESSPNTSQSRLASSSRSGRSQRTEDSQVCSTAARALPGSKPQIVVLQPSRKPTPALAVPIQDFGCRERFVQQIEVDLCASSSESSSVCRHRRSSSRSSFSGKHGFYGRRKAH